VILLYHLPKTEGRLVYEDYGIEINLVCNDKIMI
jgi:hypothetical protein